VLPHRLLLFECCDFNICEFLAPMFQKAGFQVHLVSSVAACMEAVRTAPPDVVLMITNNIRGKRAFEVAEAIRAVRPKCGFVFLAGSEEDGRECFLAAEYKFNVRAIPMSARELIAAASEAMDSPMETFVTPQARRASSDG
jgi:DNA-binding NtrC family response regulator